MAAWLFHIGLCAYAAAAAAHLANLLRPGQRERVGDLLLCVGFFFHGSAVALRAVDLVQGGAFRFAEGLSILAFLTVGAYLILGRFYRIPVLGAFLTPLVVAVLLPAHAIPGPAASPAPGWMGVARPLHIAVALGGIALFALGFVISLMYLLLQRELKSKKLGTMFHRLPSLALLDRLTHMLVAWGFLLLSLTIVSGALFPLAQAAPRIALQPKEVMALLAWGLSASILLVRRALGWRGRRVAWATMAGFAFLVVAYAGVFLGRVA